MKQFVDNIMRVKGVIRGWEKTLATKSQVDLKEVEEGIKDLLKHNCSGIFTEDDVNYLKDLERKTDLVDKENIAWRLKKDSYKVSRR